MGEHLPCKQGVKGSNPFISTHLRNQMKQYLENCIQKNTLLKIYINKTSEVMFDRKIKHPKKQTKRRTKQTRDRRARYANRAAEKSVKVKHVRA